MLGDRSIEAARASFSSRARLSGIRLERRRQELERDRPAEPGVFAAIHLAHAARAEAFADSVVLDGCADHYDVRRDSWSIRPRRGHLVRFR